MFIILFHLHCPLCTGAHQMSREFFCSLCYLSTHDCKSLGYWALSLLHWALSNLTRPWWHIKKGRCQVTGCVSVLSFLQCFDTIEICHKSIPLISKEGQLIQVHLKMAVAPLSLCFAMFSHPCVSNDMFPRRRCLTHIEQTSVTQLACHPTIHTPYQYMLSLSTENWSIKITRQRWVIWITNVWESFKKFVDWYRWAL